MGGCASLLGRSPPSVSKANTSPYIPDEFEVLYRLGKGGEGETFLAVHRETREQYALKVIRRASTINAKHLLSEIRIQSALCHANIVQLHEVLLDRRSLILVLQYIPGVSMADYLKTLRPAGAENLMPEATARFFFRQLLSALLHIQANNAAHRDLKLSNILVDTTASKKAPRLVLCDFGLSVDCENDICLHRSYTTVGTRQYMSPELLENHGAAHRKPYPPAKVDVWGLGILLYVFVVGRLPFLTCKGPADLKFDLMIASVREGHFDLCTDKTKDMFYNTHMSDSCQRLIRRMLALKPDTRISLMEVLEDPWTQGPLSKVHQAALDTMEQETRELARAACRLPRTCAEYRELEEIVREAGSGPALYSHVQADPPRDRLWRREPRFGAFDVDCGVPCVSGASRHGEDGTILRRWHPPERFCGGGGHPSIMELLEGSKSPSTQGGDSTLACNADAAMNDTAHTDTDGSKLVKLAFEASLSKDAADPHDSDSSGSDRYVTPVPTAKALCV